ncbi:MULTISPECIES: mechanosensitive ion channel family protein [unclassified Chelatococcus]|uniref:mechanosensitive ion channel family protein n=1 Tax=unclassified Chelatococcus TaxID=2638111 RepID=UPI0025BA0F79|nr:mechanosensitive ion channel family protein [Chelatococcus sp.]
MVQVWSPLALINLLGVVGIIVWHVVPRKLATTRLIAQLGFFAAMTGVLLHERIVPYRMEGFGAVETSDLILILAKVLWWIHLAWAVIGFVRLYLVIEGHPNQARLLQDIFVAVIYLGVVLAILSFVFGMNISAIVATSGVVAITLGLALQNTLGDVFSGIALSLGRPYHLGDWVVLGDGTEGRVIETNWRSTQIQTSANAIVVLPNSGLAKMAITNLERPDASQGQSITIRIAPTRMPSMVMNVMRDALASCSLLMRDPEPIVALKSIDATAIELELSYRVATLADRVPARNALLDLIYRHCKAAGLLLALPDTASAVAPGLTSEGSARMLKVGPLELIEAIPLFSLLTYDEKQRLGDAIVTRSLASGETIGGADISPGGLFMVRAGIVTIRMESREVRRLAPGDLLGMSSLLRGSQAPYSITAVVPTTLYVGDGEVITSLAGKYPALAQRLAEALEATSDAPPARGSSSDVRATIPLVLRSMRARFGR